MSSDMTGEQMQAKIAAARRDAEGLKDKIKRRKDELADATCKPSYSHSPSLASSNLQHGLNASINETQCVEWLRVIRKFCPESE